MTREEILQNARKAKERVRQAAASAEELVTRMEDTNPDAANDAARAYQETVGHLNDALNLLNQLAGRRSTE